MSAISSCCNPCDVPISTAIPGPQGEAGAAGEAGINSYTFTTEAFAVPAEGGNAVVSAANSDWMVVGQIVVTAGPAHFEVISKANSTTATLQFKNFTGDVAAGSTVPSGSQIGPSGTEPDVSGFATSGANSDITSLTGLTTPLSVSQGGTGSATKAAAQLALGVGQGITRDFDDALTYDITNSIALITGMSITVPASSTGLYKVEAGVTVLYTGVTFGSSETLSIRTRNTTTVATVSEKAVGTGIHTTTSFPAIDYVLPPISATLTAADVLELQIGLSTVESAGSSVVTDAWITITPLALS